jgi:hypothetical protein
MSIDDQPLAVTENTISPFEQPDTSSEAETSQEIRLVDIPVANENIAFNLMISFLHLAQKRGAYGMDESAKIWECLSLFIQKQQQEQ